MTEFPRDFGDIFVRVVENSDSIAEVERKLGPLTIGQAAIVSDVINQRRIEEGHRARIRRIERETMALRVAYVRRERDRLGRAHVRSRRTGRFMRILRRRR